MISSIKLITRVSFLLLALFSVVSCDKDEEIVLSPTGEILAGTWVYEGYANDVYEYSRANQLDHDRAGFIFHTNGKLTNRQNNSFCGTGPIVYENYKGSWNTEADSLVQIHSKYWGGDIDFKLEIVSVSTDKLLVRYDY